MIKAARAAPKVKGGSHPRVRYARNHHAENTIADPYAKETRRRESAHEPHTVRSEREIRIQ
jgi:hypothetical protein